MSFGTSTSPQVFRRLSTLLEERGECYANANVRISLESTWACTYSNLCPLHYFLLCLHAFENFYYVKRCDSKCSCCTDIAMKQGYRDVSSITPTAIVIEVYSVRVFS